MSALTGRTPRASFGAVAFDIQGDPGATLFPDATSYVAEDLHYGTATYVQILGPKSGEVPLTVVLTPAALVALRGLRGTQATLTLANGDARAATLLGIAGARAYAEGYATATVTFYI